jgi:hypothetical protein
MLLALALALFAASTYVLTFLPVLDPLLEQLVLSHGWPIAKPDVSRCRPGTRDEANAAGGFTRSGLSCGFRASGVQQWDVFPGGPPQEYWEMCWQQWKLVLAGIPLLIEGTLVGLVLDATAHQAAFVALGVAAGLGAGILAYTRQTGRSEIFSHTISWRDAIAGGVTEPRADEAYVDNLPAYDYGLGWSRNTPAQFKALMMARRADAEAWCQRPDAQEVFAWSVKVQQGAPKPADGQ